MLPRRAYTPVACLIFVLAAASSVYAVSPAVGDACVCDSDVVEQLLGVLRRASSQYDVLAQRFARLKAQAASRDAILAVPLEVWFGFGLLAAWACARLGAVRARARTGATAQQLSRDLSQRTTQWKVAVAEATDLAALLQQQRSAAPSPIGMFAAAAAELAAAETVAADDAADAQAVGGADTSKAAERETGACKVGGRIVAHQQAAALQMTPRAL
jgi:hypothetical protein